MSFSHYYISLCRHITGIANSILNQILTFSVTSLATETWYIPTLSTWLQLVIIIIIITNHYRSHLLPETSCLNCEGTMGTLCEAKIFHLLSIIKCVLEWKYKYLYIHKFGWCHECSTKWLIMVTITPTQLKETTATIIRLIAHLKVQNLMGNVFVILRSLIRYCFYICVT